MGSKDSGSKAAKAQAWGAELGIKEQRRQFEFIRDLMAPYVEAGRQGVPGMVEGSSLSGFAGNLNEILSSPELDPLRKQRQEAINQQMGKAGLLRSGARSQAISGDLSDYAIGLENMLFGRQANLAASGQNAAAGLGGFGQQTGANIANLYGQQGQAAASGILADAQAQNAFINQLMGLGIGAGAGALAGSTGALGSGIGAGGGAALGLLFSDSRLKDNLRPMGNMGPLTVYEWDWIPEFEALGFDTSMRVGFLAEDVEQIFPEFVHKTGPFKALDYAGLLDKLEKVTH